MRAALVAQEADVGARVFLAQRRRELVAPGLPGGLVLGPLVERGEVDMIRLARWANAVASAGT
jgi:hypothetical protein